MSHFVRNVKLTEQKDTPMKLHSLIGHLQIPDVTLTLLFRGHAKIMTNVCIPILYMSE